MSRIIIGKYSGYNVPAIEAVNPHILVTGMSGTGKSVFCQSQIVQRAEAGERIIAFNYDNVLDRSQMLPEIRKLYDKNCHVINVVDGIPIPLFTPLVNAEGKKESADATIHRVTSILRVAGNLTEAQARELNAAVKYVYQKETYSAFGIKAISRKLEDIGTPIAYRTLGNLRAIFDSNAIVDGDFFDNDKRIIELNFEGIEYDDEQAIVRFVSDYVMRLAKTMYFADNPITIFLDEVHNFDFGAKSTMRSLVNEARKYSVTLLMATTSIVSNGKTKMSVLNQAGTRIVFRPPSNECRDTAELLDKRRKSFLICELVDLKRGQFIYSVSARDASAGKSFDVLETFLPPLSDEE